MNIKFQVDTGASISVINKDDFLDMIKVPLTHSSKNLKTYTGEKVDISGEAMEVCDGARLQRDGIIEAVEHSEHQDQIRLTVTGVSDTVELPFVPPVEAPYLVDQSLHEEREIIEKLPNSHTQDENETTAGKQPLLAEQEESKTGNELPKLTASCTSNSNSGHGFEPTRTRSGRGPEGFFQQQVKNGNVECYFDASKRIMYMQLTSCYDTNFLLAKCHELSKSSQSENFYTLWQDEDVKHAKTLLLLLTISHILILFYPGGMFDLSYLRLFHSLETVRGKLHTSMCEVLSAIPGVSSKWSNFGRVCTPRMLFVFESPSIDVQPEDAESAASKSSKKYPPLRKLQIGIEDMIFRILRKTRAITNIS
ncbi:protein smg8 [Plakobranchus ocellatus]|uniref:Nonsense-mediated mRNA decay factor SMG8 n=1 Tax=Plakobranchus ocellatus TaxID=259542 RepID=A0AAV3ZN24_9GAST|nr:protein smg8 [Plakobranchus ocellatus]